MTAPILHRTASALTLAAAFVAAPVLAQDAPTAAPLVIQPAPAPVPQAAAPAAPAAPVAAPEAVAPPAATATAPVAEEPALRTTRQAAPRSVARPASRTAPVAATPTAVAPATAPAPVAAPAEPAPVAAAPVAAPVTEAPAPQAATTTQTQQTRSTPLWPLAAIAALIIAAGAFFFLRGRRRAEEDAYYEEEAVAPVYAEPVAAEPVIVAPGIAADDLGYIAPVEEHADLATADAEEVAALAASDAPAGRPWIELSFRPLRAGTVEESALVDVELTLGNAGDVAARDVRVSTFMLGDQSDAPTEMDGLLATRHEGTQVSAGSIEPGEGSRIDATLTVPRDSVTGATFSPVVVADVRYTLPNGQEGRTAASFVVGGANEDETLTPLRNGGDMRDDVSAALHGELERA